MAKVPGERYRPGELPTELPALITHLYDEFFRIAQALVEFPVGFNVKQQVAGVPVTTIPTEFRLFEGEPADLDLPGGNWDSALGEWTVPLNGIYQINVNCVVEPYGSGNKDYGANLKLYIDDVLAWQNTDVGDDAYTLSCSLAISGLLVRESIVRTTIELVHDQFVGVTTVTSFWSITISAAE